MRGAPSGADDYEHAVKLTLQLQPLLPPTLFLKNAQALLALFTVPLALRIIRIAMGA